MTSAPKPAIQMSATLNVEERRVLTMSTDAKPNAADGVDQRIGMLIVDLAANAAEIDVDDVGGRVEVEVPYMLQQHGPRHDLTLVADQIFEHLKLARQELDLLAGAIGGARDKVEFEVADAQHRFLHHCRTSPRQRFDACQELGEGERLDQIVVAAAAQAAHAIVDFAERTDDQGRRIDPGVAQLPDDGETIQPRKHAVDRDHRIVGGSRKLQPLVAVEREVHVIAALAEKIDELASSFQIV